MHNTSCIRYNCMVSILIHLVSQDTRIWILLGTSYQSAFCRVGKLRMAEKVQSTPPMQEDKSKTVGKVDGKHGSTPPPPKPRTSNVEDWKR